MANYYDEYRNDLYNPDDGHDTRKPGRNANWKAIQKGFKDTQGEIDRLDGRVDGLEKRVETAEEHVANLEERVTNEEAFNREQQVAIDANTAKNTEQDNRLDGIDDAIERIDAKDAEQDGRLDALEESQDAQDVLIKEHGNRLTAHDASIADINTRISRINAKDDEQDAAIADINAKDTEQDNAISDLADEVQRIDDSVNRVATDPATSRSTRIGNNSNNLTVSTHSENETKSMDFIDNVNEDSVQFGFLENDTGHMVTFGNLAFNFDDINDKNNAQDAAITTLQDKVRRTTTDPATSRSTRIGNDTNNLTIAAAKDAEGMSVQITDNADNDPIRVGFESDAGGDSIIVGGNSYKLGEGGVDKVRAFIINNVRIPTIAANSFGVYSIGTKHCTLPKPNTAYTMFGYVYSLTTDPAGDGLILNLQGNASVRTDSNYSVTITPNILWANVSSTALSNKGIACNILFVEGNYTV